MISDNYMPYDKSDYIVAKTEYMVEHANWFFQMIVPKVPVTQLPKFNFEYSLCDCSKHQNFTKGKTWEKILNNDRPVIFINTDAMFKEFEKVQELDFRYKKPGAAAFAQYFYRFYRDKFWRGNYSKLIFFVEESDIDNIFQNVDHGGFAIPFCTPWYMDNEELEKTSIVATKKT